MLVNYKDFVLEKCGVFIDKEYFWMYVIFDFFCFCFCCGKGCGEVKCFYLIDDCDFDSYIVKKGVCLEKVDGKIWFKRNY